MCGEKEEQQTILVVEDEPVVQQLHKRILESAGYRVTLASDGSQGIKIMEEIKPDLVILDVMMPGINGYQTLEIIRKTSDVPVIMVTALRGAETVQKSLGLGADDYVTKPFSPSVLLSRVQAKLRRAGWEKGRKGKMLVKNSDILLADDDPKMLRRLSNALQKSGYQVAVTSDGAAVLKQVSEKQRLSLAILELESEKDDGVETCRRLREVSDVPIIILARKPGVEKIVQGLQCGADDFIAKPFSIAEFMARINAVLSCASFVKRAAKMIG